MLGEREMPDLKTINTNICCQMRPKISVLIDFVANETRDHLALGSSSTFQYMYNIYLANMVQLQPNIFLSIMISDVVTIEQSAIQRSII